MELLATNAVAYINTHLRTNPVIMEYVEKEADDEIVSRYHIPKEHIQSVCDKVPNFSTLRANLVNAGLLGVYMVQLKQASVKHV